LTLSARASGTRPEFCRPAFQPRSRVETDRDREAKSARRPLILFQGGIVGREGQAEVESAALGAGGRRRGGHRAPAHQMPLTCRAFTHSAGIKSTGPSNMISANVCSSVGLASP
jgi:hypothetical protein